MGKYLKIFTTKDELINYVSGSTLELPFVGYNEEEGPEVVYYNPELVVGGEIYYTSTDENIVTPYSTTGFGANIISNTYEGGQGVIKFDGPVTSIGEEAFAYCTTLTSITIPNSVISIEEKAFNWCMNLTGITIPDSVESIGKLAFEGCQSFTSITIPDSVTYIGEWAFSSCSNLTGITVESTTPATLGGGAFNSTNNCPIYVPCESVDDYKTAWSAYADRIQCDEPIHTDIPLQWIGNGNFTEAAKDVYFDTGMIMSGDLKNRGIRISFLSPGYNTGSELQCVLGCSDSNNLIRVLSYSESYPEQRHQFKLDLGPSNYGCASDLITNLKIETSCWIYQNRAQFKTNTRQTYSDSYSARTGSNSSLYLFAQHNGNTANLKCYGGTRIYEVALFDNCTPSADGFTGTPTKKFTPVLHWNGTDYVPCFKEEIGSTYIYNLGTDSLTYSE